MMKNSLFTLLAAVLLCSCSVVKNNARNNYTTNKRGNIPSPPANNINKDRFVRILPNNNGASIPPSTKENNLNNLRLRYADILGVAPASLTNMNLIREIDEWYGTPYEYGGDDKNGIDCSGFVQILMNAVYHIQIPRTSSEQYQYCRHINASNLQEGDLVFFSSGRSITHVGVYLQNNKFVHASTSNGVIISGLDEPYWEKTFVGAGRVER